MVLFLLIGSLVTHFALVAENKKRLAGKRDHLIEGKSEQEIEMLGDNRYVLFRKILYDAYADLRLRPDFIYTV